MRRLLAAIWPTIPTQPPGGAAADQDISFGSAFRVVAGGAVMLQGMMIS